MPFNLMDIDTLKLIIAVGGMLITGGIAWGSLNGKSKSHERRITQAERNIRDIDKQQRSDGKDLTRMEAMFQHINSSIDEIKKLLQEK